MVEWNIEIKMRGKKYESTNQGDVEYICWNKTKEEVRKVKQPAWKKFENDVEQKYKENNKTFGWLLKDYRKKNKTMEWELLNAKILLN